MTNEEAIKVLRTESIELGGSVPIVCRFWEALDMAIAALREQEGKDTNAPTNADRIRAMSDEAIAEYVCRNSINTLCDIICGGECNAISTLKRSGDWACKEIVMKWLQRPAGEEDKHENYT